MIKIANQHPDQRFDAIVRSSKLTDTSKEYLDKFDVQLGNQLVCVLDTLIEDCELSLSDQGVLHGEDDADYLKGVGRQLNASGMSLRRR